EGRFPDVRHRFGHRVCHRSQRCPGYEQGLHQTHARSETRARHGPGGRPDRRSEDRNFSHCCETLTRMRVAPHPEKMWGVALPWIESQRGIRAATALPGGLDCTPFCCGAPTTILLTSGVKVGFEVVPPIVREIPFLSFEPQPTRKLLESCLNLRCRYSDSARRRAPQIVGGSAITRKNNRSQNERQHSATIRSRSRLWMAGEK